MNTCISNLLFCKLYLYLVYSILLCCTYIIIHADNENYYVSSSLPVIVFAKLKTLQQVVFSTS